MSRSRNSPSLLEVREDLKEAAAAKKAAGLIDANHEGELRVLSRRVRQEKKSWSMQRKYLKRVWK